MFTWSVDRRGFCYIYRDLCARVGWLDVIIIDFIV